MNANKWLRMIQHLCKRVGFKSSRKDKNDEHVKEENYEESMPRKLS